MTALRTAWPFISATLLFAAGCREATAPLAQPAPNPAARAQAGGPPVVEVTVTTKGFEPPRISVGPSQPVVLRITRKAAESCADAVDVEGDPVRHMLPLNRAVDIKVTTPPSGELAFACPMKMYRAALVVAGH